MTCDAFVEKLDALLHGSLAASEREEVLRHLEQCADCRGLEAALADPSPAPEDPRLAAAVLARTTGSACDSARSLLCARVDGELDAFDAELVDSHLGWCAECAGLARGLARLQEDLPLLAEVDPGERFVDAVLARTSRRPRPVPLGARIDAFLSRLLARPRVAWEGAFVVTLVLAAPILAPGSPLADLPGRAYDLVRSPSPERHRALGDLRGTVNDLEATLLGGARGAWATTSALVREDSVTVASGIARESTSTWKTIRQHLGTFPASAASGQESGEAGTSDHEPDTAQEKK